MGTADAAATAMIRVADLLSGEVDGRTRSATEAATKPASARTIQKEYFTAGAKAVWDPNGPITPSSTPKATAFRGPRHFLPIRHSRIANCIGLPLTKLRKLLTTFPIVDRHHNPPTGPHKRPNVGMEQAMKQFIAGIALASIAVPAAASEATDLRFDCAAGTATAGGEAPNLHGNWDFLMNVGATPNFGLLSIGLVGAAYGGSLSLSMTAPVVLREITLTGNRFHLAVASPAGDVLFDGTLSTKGDRMCGNVTYHDGRIFPAVAQKRPSTYQSQPQAQRAPAVTS